MDANGALLTVIAELRLNLAVAEQERDRLMLRVAELEQERGYTQEVAHD